VQLKIDNDVVNHLLFHKALVDENDDATQINKYVNMVQSGDVGEISSISNPFERSIAILFDLVINQNLNPWDIDLVNFSSMYLKRAKEEKINLITAGRIIYMAWKVLRLQSDNLVIDMESKEEIEPELFDWTDIPEGGWMGDDAGYSYTNLVMKMPQPPLEEPLRRTSQRKVTLMELIDAFDHARKESEEFQILEKARKEEKLRLADLARKHMKGTAHEDHIEEDVALVWKKIKQSKKKLITLGDLYESDSVEERIKLMLSVLFLAYDNKVKVFQKQFPYGKIFIKSLGYT